MLSYKNVTHQSYDLKKIKSSAHHSENKQSYIDVLDTLTWWAASIYISVCVEPFKFNYLNVLQITSNYEKKEIVIDKKISLVTIQ